MSSIETILSQRQYGLVHARVRACGARMNLDLSTNATLASNGFTTICLFNIITRHHLKEEEDDDEQEVEEDGEMLDEEEDQEEQALTHAYPHARAHAHTHARAMRTHTHT